MMKNDCVIMVIQMYLANLKNTTLVFGHTHKFCTVLLFFSRVRLHLNFLILSMLSCCVNVLRVLALSPLTMCAQFCSPNGVTSSHTPPPLPPMARPTSLCCGFSSEWKLFNRGCVLYAEILDVAVMLYEMQTLWGVNKAFFHLVFQGQRSQDNHFFFLCGLATMSQKFESNVLTDYNQD